MKVKKERVSDKNNLLRLYHQLARQEEHALESANLELLAKTRIDLANILVKNGAYQEALAKNLQAETYLKTKNNTILLAKCWRYMAIIYGYLGNLNKRIYYNLLTLEALKKGDDETEITKVLNNLGHCYLENGSYKKALPIFLTNLENDLSDDLYGATQKNLGQLYFETKQYEKAEQYFTNTLKFSKEKRLNVYIGGSLHFLGMIALEKQQYPKAETYIDQAIEVASKLNISKKLQLGLLESKIKVLVELGKYEELKSILKEYKKLNIELNEQVVNQSNKSIQFLYEIHEKEKEQALLKERNSHLKSHNIELKQFAHTVSHDLKQPIRTVNSFVGLLKRELGDNLTERGNEFFEIINSSCQEMITFVDSVLRFAENNSTKPFEQVDCQQIMAKVLKNLNAQLEETGGTVEYSDLPSIPGYQAEILQIFQNLISNSLKFRRAGVKPKIKVSASRKLRNWVFKFKDNGIGIKEEDKKNIFNLFERLDSNGNSEGSGIGLSTVLKIVKRYAGTINIESILGEGSTFVLTLPDFNTIARVS